MSHQFISARNIAQRLAMAGQVMNDTPQAREALRKMTRTWNRQTSPVGFKVDVTADSAGYRQYQLYYWDYAASREVILGAGVAKGSLERVQAVARREAAALNTHP